MEENKIYHCDCMEGMKLIPDGSIDMILCDLPYGISKNKWDEVIPIAPLWRQYNRVIKENGAIVLFGSGMFTARLMTSNPDNWRYNLIWEKSTPSGYLNAKRMPLRSHEDICIFYKKAPVYHPLMTDGHGRKVSLARHKVNCRKSTTYGSYEDIDYDSTQRYPKSVLRFPTDRQFLSIHPTQKPVALLEWLIETYTDKGNIVLDNCIGSGSTAVAALWTGRRFIGFENDAEYYSKSCERVFHSDISLERHRKKEEIHV